MWHHRFVVISIIWSCALFVHPGVSERRKDGKLLFAHVIFRHGARTPIDPYPLDPYRDPSAWNNTEWGELTNEGKRQQYDLGKWLKLRYQGLVNDTYYPDDIYIRSTDVDRALMSAMANLAGFYPPQNMDVWKTDLSWQPIPVHTKPVKEDNVLAGEKYCPRYDYLKNKFYESKEFLALEKKYEATFAYLKNHTGLPFIDFREAQYVYSVLFIEQFNHKKLPEWANQVFPHPLSEISALSFKFLAYTREMARLRAGLLLKEMLDRFDNKTRNELRPNRGMWIYSGHDTTIANILNILGLFEEPFSPPFTSTVMFELRLIDDIHPYVYVYYKNGMDDTEAHLLEIPNCGPKCPLDKMYQLYDAVLPRNWEEECKLATLAMSYEDANVVSGLVPMTLLPAALVLFTIILLLLIISGSTIHRWRRTNDDPKWYLRMYDT